MSTERQGGVLIFSCDKCAEIYEPTTGIFGPAWQEAKTEGWRAFKQGDVWCHSCPDCSLKFSQHPT
jgi:ribosomal protein L37AE/L43A